MKKIILLLGLLASWAYADTGVTMYDSSTVNYIQLKAPQSFPATYRFVMPVNPGTTNQVLAIGSVGGNNTLNGIFVNISSGGYTGPTVSMTSSPSGAAEELGTSVSSTFTATTVAGSSPITTFVLKKNGTTVFTDPTPNPNGGAEMYNDPAITATGAYVAYVGDGTSTGNSNTITFSFVYPFYYGVGAQALSFASVQGLTKLVQVKQTNTSVTTSPSNQVYYFAYPQAYGSLTKILDPNGFNITNGFTQRSGTMTMLDSTTQNYYVYEFNNLTTQTNFTITYEF